MQLTQSVIWPAVTVWVAARNLDTEFSKKYPLHDMVHVQFKLPHTKEGIVLAIEEAITTGVLPNKTAFVLLCKDLKLDTDTYGLRDSMKVWDTIEQAWPITVVLDL